MIEEFISNILNGKTSKTSVIDQLYKKPQKEVKGDNPTFPYIDKNYLHQIDLLYLPNDQGFLYCMVVVDQGSRYVAAEAMADRTVVDAIKTLKAIYKNSKYLQKPKVIVTDAGKEFSKIFTYELGQMDITHKIVKVGRHRSVSLAERKNQTIGKIIHKIIAQVQLTSKNPSSKWVSYLPVIIKAINKTITDKPRKTKPDVPLTFNPDHKIDLLNEGDKVRVALDNPVDVEGKTLNGKFRSSDIRFNPTIRTVQYVYTKPNQPIMYFLNGSQGDLKIETVGYTRNQLQKVSNLEKSVDLVEPLFENENNRFEFQEIKNRRAKGRSYEYLVKFKNYRKTEWVSRKSLVEDLGVSYMKKIDFKFDQA